MSPAAALPFLVRRSLAVVVFAVVLPSGAQADVPLGWDIGSQTPDFSAFYLAGAPGVETSTNWHAEMGKADVYVVSTCAMWCAPCQQFAQQAAAMKQALAAEGIGVEFYDFIFQNTAMQEPGSADAQAWIDNIWSSDAENVWYGGNISETDPDSVVIDMFTAAQNAGGSGTAIPSIAVLDRNFVVREFVEGFSQSQLESKIGSVYAASKRSSLNYALRPESFSSGALQTVSARANYTIDGALDVAGGGIATSANYVVKPGYIGQLYDVTTLSLNVSSILTIAEEGTRDLGDLVVSAVLDDETTIRLRSHEVLWSPVFGPLTGIDELGVATAGAVFEDMPALAQGSFLGGSRDLDLLVLDLAPDNFEAYAGDGLDDDWQVGFFGLPPNVDAGPGKNPDKDPHDNRFEFLTGYDPTDGSDFFRFRVVDRGASRVTLQLSKVIPGTRYRFERSRDLEATGFWGEFLDIASPVELLDHQEMDSSATDTIQYYRVGVERDEEIEED